MVDQNPTTDAPGGSRSDFFEAVKGLPFTKDQAFSTSTVYARFLQELAYYRADEPYLTVDKCAARCLKLSVLLTAALARSDRP